MGYTGLCRADSLFILHRDRLQCRFPLGSVLFVSASVSFNVNETVLFRFVVTVHDKICDFAGTKVNSAIGKRVIKNVEKFQSNYLFIFLGLVIFCM